MTVVYKIKARRVVFTMIIKHSKQEKLSKPLNGPEFGNIKFKKTYKTGLAN